MRLNFTQLILFCGLLLFGCNSQETEKDITGDPVSRHSGAAPKYEGKPGDLVIVMDEPYWSEEPGELIRSYFAKAIPPFYPEENIFNVTRVTHNNFGKYYKAKANIIICNIDGQKGKSTGAEVLSNVWARDQYVVDVRSHSVQEFNETISKFGEVWAENFSEKEIFRLQDNDVHNPNRELNGLIRENMGVSMVFPYGANELKVSDSVMLIERIRKRIKGNRSALVLQGFMIFREDYVDRKQFSEDYRIKKLNLMLRKYIHGKVENSYMEVVKDERFKPIFKVTGLNDYAVELTGRVGMVNDFAGGYFVCISTIDPETKDMITYFGYVHAPPFSKRNYLKEIEAIGYSMEF